MPRVQSILRNNVDRYEALKIEQTIYFEMTVISKTYTLVNTCVSPNHTLVSGCNGNSGQNFY